MKHITRLFVLWSFILLGFNSAPASVFGQNGGVSILQSVSAPMSLSPYNRAIRSDLSIIFSWHTVSGATGYQIQIATNNTFNNIVHNGNLATTSYNYTLPEARTYYWRVRAMVNTQTGLWSSVNELIIAPTLTAPAMMALVNNPTVNFSWIPITGISQYQIQISRNWEFTEIEDDQTVNANNHTFTLPYFSDYYWRVRANVSNSSWSDVRRVNYDITPHYRDGDIRYMMPADVGLHFHYNKDTFYVYRHMYTFEYDIYGNIIQEIPYPSSSSPLPPPGTTGLMLPYLMDISRDGRYLLFEMVFWIVHATTSRPNAYIYDTQLGIWTQLGRIDVYSKAISMSDDGRYSIFVTAEALSPEDTDMSEDIYLYDLSTNEIRYIPRNLPTTSSNATIHGDISPNNQYIAYIYSDITGNNNYTEYIIGRLYLYHIPTRQVTQVNAPNGNPITTRRQMRFSPDGRYLMFASNMSNIVPNDTNNKEDVFIYDLQTQQFKRISINSNGEQANDDAYIGAFSSDMRFVTFSSRATNLVMNGINTNNLFIHELETGDTSLISQNFYGVPNNISSVGESIPSWIFHNNRFVMFVINSTNLSPIAPNNMRSNLLLATRRPTIAPADVPFFSTPSLNTQTALTTRRFDWKEVVDATYYHVQIATDSNFNNLIYDVSSPFVVSEFNFTFPSDGIYFARIQAGNSIGETVWSDVHQITLDTSANMTLNEQQLFDLAQYNLIGEITFILFDITPTGIFTTVQFNDGTVVTATIYIALENGLFRIMLDGVSGGTEEHRAIFNQDMPTIFINTIDEVLSVNQVSFESVELTTSSMNIYAFPLNP